ncbi:VWA domain-containing protein [Aeromonas veronii]|nr:VWA domain-containing protein [Aeromonas veronii]
MKNTHHATVYQSIRLVNETLSALWANLHPLYSDSIQTLSTRYDSDEGRFVLLLNERFWLSLNHADRCFIACVELFKILLEHNRRTHYLIDRPCAHKASTIIANEHVIRHLSLNYPAMSIMERISRIDNSIPPHFRETVREKSSLELIYAILLKVRANNASSQQKPDPQVNQPQGQGSEQRGEAVEKDAQVAEPTHDDQNPAPENDGDDTEGLTQGEEQAGAGGNATEPPSAEEQAPGDNGSNSSPTEGGAGGRVQNGVNAGGRSSQGEGSQDEDNLLPLDQESTASLLQQMTQTLTENALKQDLGERAKKDSDYLDMVNAEIQELTTALELEDEEDKGQLAISGLGAGVATDYWMRIEKTKRARLKKIIQRHMKFSDEPEEEEQFCYRDEILALMAETIKLPSLKELGGNKKSKRHIVLYLDCSGSCYAYAADFLKRMLSAKKAEIQLDAFMFDVKVMPIEIEQSRRNGHRHEVALSRGGGTSFRCVVEHANQLLKNRDVDKRSLFIVLTDGIDHSFTPAVKSLIADKRNWYWFLTSLKRKHHITNCGKTLPLRDFI